MKEFTIYCTEEQTRRAYELGARIERHVVFCEGCVRIGKTVNNERLYGIAPTAEQMCGWLRERGLHAYAFPSNGNTGEIYIGEVDELTNNGFACLLSTEAKEPEQALLAAIDLALDYLSNSKYL